MMGAMVTHSLTPVDSVFDDSQWIVRCEYIAWVRRRRRTQSSDRRMLGVDDVDGAADDDDIDEDLLPGLPHKVPW